jgi:hypothetical protein
VRWSVGTLGRVLPFGPSNKRIHVVDYRHLIGALGKRGERRELLYRARRGKLAPYNFDIRTLGC